MQERKNTKTRFGIKALIISGLSLALLIPTLMMMNIVKDRQSLAKSVQEEIAAGAGGNLILAGPILVIPVSEERPNGHIEERKAIVLPSKLEVKAATQTEIRSRGIYSCPVFEADVVMTAVFSVHGASIEKLWSGKTSVHFDQARILLELPDTRALRQMPLVKDAQGNIVPMEADSAPIKLSPSAISGAVKLSDTPMEFTLEMKSGGGGAFGIWPLAGSVDIAFSSDWPSPSFTGDNSPIERKIDENGFSARWRQTTGTGRWPQTFDASNSRYNMGFNEKHVLGVTFFDPLGIYHKSERALKYALLFIIVPFMVILLFELFTRQRLHPIQYALVGIADVVFYALLLSLSEHIGFTAAYLVSALSVISLIVFYASSILGGIRRGLILAPVLILLYGYLYSALQSRDYALLTGSIGVFAILACIMVLTRKVNWYNTAETGNQETSKEQ